ncbi:MAG: hypothetical protein QOE93_1899 [Actinomycetota bacterium]|jgi:hypothetical protein|nr:hypothetical protein [Actinomycetota bacterium]
MHSFLVRVWSPADDRSRWTDLRGVVRDVTTGVETTFRSDDELLRLLALPVTAVLNRHGSPAGAGSTARREDKR